MTYNGGAREVSCRVDVMRGGVPHTTLLPLEPPVVTMDTAAEIKMRMSGMFLLNPEADFFNDTIRPWLILDGVEYPVGEYVVGTVDETWTDGATSLAIEAYDAALLLQQWTIEDFHYIPAGERYENAIQSFLQRADIKRAIIDPTDEVFLTDREDWEPGTPFLTIINTLLSEIGYDDVWFDLNGIARLRAYTPPSAANITHTYRSGENSLLLPHFTRTLDIYSAPNVFNAVVNNPEYPSVLSATAENDSLASALSIPRRERRIVAPTVELDNIASQAALQAHVDKIKFESMKADEIIAFETAAVPTHSVGDVISLSIDEAGLSGVYAETGWTLTLGPGVPMQHTARRTIVID